MGFFILVALLAIDLDVAVAVSEEVLPDQHRRLVVADRGGLDLLVEDDRRRGGGHGEGRRILRRLCETGAVLAVAADMEKAVVVRETADGRVVFVEADGVGWDEYVEIRLPDGEVRHGVVIDVDADALDRQGAALDPAEQALRRAQRLGELRIGRERLLGQRVEAEVGDVAVDVVPHFVDFLLALLPAGGDRGHPALDPEPVERRDSGVLGLAAADEMLGGTIDAGNNGVASSFSVDLLTAGDRRTGSGDRIGPSGYESRAARWALAGRPDDDRSWLFDVHYLEQPETPRVDELVPGFGQAEPSSSEFFFKPNRRVFVHGKYGHEDGALGLDWNVDLAWQRIDDDRVSRDFEATDRRFESNRSDLYGFVVSGSRVTDSGSWVAGIEAYRDEVSSARSEENLLDGQTRLWRRRAGRLDRDLPA